MSNDLTIHDLSDTVSRLDALAAQMKALGAVETEPEHNPHECDIERCRDCQEYWIDVIADQKYDAMRGN